MSNERDALVAELAAVAARANDKGGTALICESLVREAIQALAAPAEGDIYEAYKAWPADIRKKLSLHDLRRMSGWARKSAADGWRIDMSAGRPILVHNNCSVIEDDEARYVLRLIVRDQQPASPPIAEGDGAVLPVLDAAKGFADVNDDGDYVFTPAGLCEFEKVRTRPAATAVVPDGFVLVPRAAALVAAAVADEWAAMFADIPGLEKYDRFQYGPAVEQMRDDMLAAAPAAPKDGVVDEEIETKARLLFANQADKFALPWDRQWEPTRNYWRDKARAALATGEQP